VTDGFIALVRASAEFERRLRRVGAHDWSRPTPCAEWDVRALVNHVIGGNRRYVMLLHGASADDVNRTRTADHLGDDPVGSFATTAAALAATFREEGALSRMAHHPLGERSGEQLLGMRVVDLAVHAWDLARALDVDDALDPEAVAFALAQTELIEAGREQGSFVGATGELRPDAPPQARLLHLTGRTEGDRP
jgi:uncharacterized protein (TIGR03086 family)